jgi:hypothetical protein
MTMSRVKQELIISLIKEINLDALKTVLDDSIDDYEEVNSLIQSGAYTMAGKLGVVLSSEAFPFQELRYAAEKERTRPLLKIALENYDFYPIRSYLKEASGIRRPAIVFELVLDYYDGTSSPQLAELVHDCMQGLYPKRDMKELLDLLRETIRSKLFWNEFISLVVESIDPIFTNVLADVALVLLMEGFGLLYQRFSTDQRLFLLPHFLDRFGLETVLSEHREYILTALQEDVYDWLETNAIKEAPKSARDELKRLIKIHKKD